MSNDIIETVQCYYCGKTLSDDISPKFDGKRFCGMPHVRKWAAHLKKSGALRPKDAAQRAKKIKVSPKPQKQETGWFDWLFGKKKNPNIPKVYRR